MLDPFFGFNSRRIALAQRQAVEQYRSMMQGQALYSQMVMQRQAYERGELSGLAAAQYAYAASNSDEAIAWNEWGRRYRSALDCEICGSHESISQHGDGMRCAICGSH